MGGHHAGEMASQVVALLLPCFLEQRARQEQVWSPQKREQVLQEAVLELSRQLQQESAGRPGQGGAVHRPPGTSGG